MLLKFDFKNIVKVLSRESFILRNIHHPRSVSILVVFVFMIINKEERFQG